jgi:hypothetical protein
MAVWRRGSMDALMPSSLAEEDPSLWIEGFIVYINLQFDDAQARFYRWKQ